MDIDQYYQTLQDLAGQFSKSTQSTHDFLEELIARNEPIIEELIAFRKALVGSKELEEVRSFLVIGYFQKYSGLERATCFIICFELNEIVTKLNWRQRCEPYTGSQPLFRKSPALFENIHNNDLIDFKVLEQVNGSEIVKFANGYGYLDWTLNPMIASWTKQTFPNHEIFVRVNPQEFFERQPRQRLFESILMPANPNWWKNLSIHNRMKEGASYMLDDCSPKENMQQYWELHVKGIKRLEVIAKRNNNGNLSMMVEEISNVDNLGLVFGRCIHLDTDAPCGTSFENSRLNHIDLAINIYEGETAKQRLGDNLALGQVTTDASYRTHLIKILDVPFKVLFAYVISFLQSQTLINEWLEDQFRE
jgi:hypothetical protein